MSSFFDEKSTQIEPNTITAFGIGLHSRYGKADEMMEMLACAMEIAKAGSNEIVKEIFFDSKAAICTIEFSADVAEFDPDVREVFAAAKKTLRQFDWFDQVFHRDDPNEN